MNYLRVRYRHDVKCWHDDCSELIVLEGRTSDAVYPDGAPVKLDGRDGDVRSGFILHCPAGHEVDLYSPRDLQVVRSTSAEADYPPIVLRTSLT